MVIVTQNQYLLASKIHHITLDENVNYIDARNKYGKSISIRDVTYQITIIYSPDSVIGVNNSTSRSAEEQRECSVVIRSATNAHKVFKDLIQQIREQMPDQLYLDTALERMIANIDLTSLIESDVRNKEDEYSDKPTIMEKKHDRKSKKIRKSGKAKRANKSVLRKSK